MLMDSAGTASSWFEICAVRELDQEGAKVLYSDQIYLRAVSQQSPYYVNASPGLLNASPDPLRNTNMNKVEQADKVEVNCSHYHLKWRAKQYMSQKDVAKNSETVLTGDSFRIYSRIANGYLVASKNMKIEDDQNPKLYVEQGNETS